MEDRILAMLAARYIIELHGQLDQLRAENAELRNKIGPQEVKAEEPKHDAG